MNIYKISQSSNDDYDTYDSAIVIAENEEDAKTIHPNGDCDWPNLESDRRCWDWVTDLRLIKVELIGVADNKGKGVVLASFNAG